MDVTSEGPGAARPDDLPAVQPRERVLRARDVAILWGDLGVGLLVLVTGALLVPGLGFGAALAVTVAGSIVGCALLASVARAGAERRLPTMVLLRTVVGEKGSWIPTALNVLQLLGWTAVELWAMSFVADLVAREVFGFSARPLWLVTAAIVCTGLALWGPVGVTRVWMERFGVWVIGGICLALTAAVLLDGQTRALLGRPGVGGFPTLGPALDLVIAMPVSWLPLVADYTRFARDGRAASRGTFWGYLVANIWLYALGAALVLAGGAEPTPAGIATGILALASGTAAGIAFLTGLLVGETDEAFANIYSCAVSIRNVVPRAPQKALVIGVAAVGAVMAAFLDMVLYESFLFLIGSVFVPLFGVVIADTRRPSISEPQAWRAGPLAAWAAGFALYHLINPSPLEAWTTWLQDTVGTPLSVTLPWLNASIPAFLVSYLLTRIGGLHISSGRRTPISR